MSYWIYLLSFLLGNIFGSFVNAAVWRVRQGLTFVRDRSRCDKCRQVIKWYDNLPLVGYINLRGRCRMCGERISLYYPLGELVLGILFLVFAVLNGGEHADLAKLLFAWSAITFLAFNFIYDARYGEILDGATLVPGVIFFIFSVAFGLQKPLSMLVGATVGGGIFFIQYVISKGRWIGGGDVRLGVFMGVILGWPNILVALFAAYMAGGLVASILLISRRAGLKTEIPFGTFLAAATIFAAIVGKNIIEWYLGILGI